MKSDWTKSTIGEVCVLVTDGSHFSPKSVEKGRPMVSVKDFTEYGFNFSSCKSISEEDWLLLERNGCVPCYNDILIGKDGARYFEDIIIYRQDEKPALLSSIAILRCDENVVIPEFLYHMLRTPSFRKDVRDNYGSGSAIPRIILKDFKRMPVFYPPLETQRKIAAILSALDDKIELNRRINENLEEQAAAIFDSWLIRNIESGKTVSLDEVCAKVTDGSHFSPKDDSSSSIPMFSVKDMERYDFDFKSCKHISDADFEKMVANDCVPRINDILVAKDGSYLKEIFICNEARKIAVLSSIAIFRPNLERVIPEILLAFLKSPAILKIVRENFVSGSALPRIVLKDFKKLKFMLPDVEKQSEIAPLLAVFRRQIGNNVMENVRLNILRDALLPRLMSGEIDVSDVSL